MFLPRRMFVAQMLALAACERPDPRPPPGEIAKPRPPEKTPHRPARYRLQLDLDPAARRFEGALEIEIAAGSTGQRLTLDCVDLEVLSVTTTAGTLGFSADAGRLLVDVPSDWPPASLQTVSLSYRGASSNGLRMYDDMAYTAFHTPRWMPCDFNPGTRAVFELSLSRPPGWFGLGNGPSIRTAERTESTMEAPYPAYTYGFAAGACWSRVATVQKRSIEVLGSRGTPREVERCAGAIGDMLAFFEDKTGVPYPSERFGVAFCRGTVMQEHHGFAVLPEDYAFEWLAEPMEDWLFCHELAHSWWGNLVTCESWSHFWLNEAFATFMTAVYKGHKWGEREYDRERGLARRRWEKMVRAGKGRPLELSPGATSEDASGPWSYAYGVEVLHAARARLGEYEFFRAVRRFVEKNAGSGVTTDHFLDAFAQNDDAVRGDLGKLVRSVPAAPDRAAEPIESLVATATSGAPDVDRYLALAALDDRCADPSKAGCAAVPAAIGALTADPSRLVGAAAKRLRRRPRLAFWDQQRRGANFFDIVETYDRMRAAADAGIEFIRLAPTKWKTGFRDFLLGSADHFTALTEADARVLDRVLDDAMKAGLKVVLTTLSLPGARYKQQNGDEEDVRLWQRDTFQLAAADFWAKLVRRIGAHDALVAYDVLNEPHPEAIHGIFDATDPKAASFAKSTRDTPADLHRFNRRMVASIRSADPITPIVLESSLDASPAAFGSLETVSDTSILYSFHMYEPWLFTSHKNKGKYRYPGPIPVDESPGAATEAWDRAAVRRAMAMPFSWCEEHKVARNRILVGELGCNRLAPGAAEYLEHVVSFLEEAGVHWAFYSFREDEWDGMDYELGDKAANKTRADNPLWRVLSSRLSAGRPRP